MHEGTILVVVTLLLVVTTQADQATVVVGNLEYLLYRFDDQNGRLSFNDANATCVNISGELALINTETIQNAIQQQLELWKIQPNNGWTQWVRGYWIGGYCSDNCNVFGKKGSTSNQVNWKWSNGSGIYDGYENWYSNLEPNGASNQAAYVYNFNDMWGYSKTFGAWGDDSVNNPKNYICQRDDKCKQNPCQNGGTCQNTASGSYTCHCATGFGEKHCATEYCNPNPCQNGGTCTGIDGGYACDCQVGFTGTNCSTDLCDPSPCQNGGTCIGTNGGYKCDCPIGVVGTYCETDLCNPSPCENGGTCNRLDGDYKCYCPPGVIDRNCTTDLCDSSPCQNDGTCIGTDGGYKCDCQGGYNGTYCGTDLCDFKTCQNGGTCHNAGDAIKCNCVAGFYGNDCENTPCTSSPCQNMGTCNINPPGYICNCGDGYIGTDCETDLCKVGTCENEGTCNRMPGNFSCTCLPAYEGRQCSIATFSLNTQGTCAVHVNNKGVTFEHAKSNCVSLNGALLIIKDENTQHWTEQVVQTIYPNSKAAGSIYWIGGQNETGWKWLDGSDIPTSSNEDGFQNWFKSDDVSTKECLSMTYPFNNDSLKWTNENCGTTAGYICERTDLDPCQNHTCQNGAKCSSSGCHYSCVCASGFTGTDCENVVAGPPSGSGEEIWIAIGIVIPLCILLAIGGYMFYKRRKPKEKTAGQAETNRNNGTNNGTVPVIYENLTRFPGKKNFSEYKISASGLLRHYQDTCANVNHDGYDNEFGNILSTESIKAASSTDAALLPENKPKNRFKNILPYDSYRVVLNDGRPGGDYINASYINCHDVPRKFIASQGPTPRTIQDFWRMIWQDEVAVVVMLTNVTEGGKRKCEKYWPEPNETLTFGPFEVKAKEEGYYGCYVVRTFEVANKDNVYESVIRKLKHFQYVTWPDHGVPVSTTGFYRLHTHVMEEHNSAGNEAPIVVHCSAGVGRTGTFIGFDCLVRMIEDKAAANVFEVVLNMRMQRTDMVQTKAQYALLYKLITETYVLKNTDFAGEELDEKIANLTRTNRSTHKNGFEVEFSNTNIIEPLTTTKVYPPGQDSGNSSSDIVSYKHSQVLLPPMQGDTDLTYYNASTILGYGKSETAIAAQGPIRHDMVEKFWLAITSLQIRTIVMLNNFFENDTVQCHDYFPTCVGDSKQYGDTTVRLASCDASDNITSRKLQVIKDKIQMEINHYQLSGWPDKGVPRTCESVLDLAAKTQTSSQQQGGGVLVHCRDGSGRTGTFLAIINVIERIKNENQIDVFRTVKDLRDSRPEMVSNLQQYKFIYNTASAYMRSFATYDNFTPAVKM